MSNEILEFEFTEVTIGKKTYKIPSLIKIDVSGTELTFPDIEKCRGFILSGVTDKKKKIGPILEDLKKRATDSTVADNIKAVKDSIGSLSVESFEKNDLVEHILIDNKVFADFLADRTHVFDDSISATVTLVDGSEVKRKGKELHDLLTAKVPATLKTPSRYLLCTDLDKPDKYLELYETYPGTIITTILTKDVYNYLDAKKGSSPSVRDYVENNRYVVDKREVADRGASRGFKEFPVGTKITIYRDKNTADKKFIKAVIEYDTGPITITDETTFKDIMKNFTGKKEYVDIISESEKKGVPVKIKNISVNGGKLKKIIAWAAGVVLVAGGLHHGGKALVEYFKNKAANTRNNTEQFQQVDKDLTKDPLEEVLNRSGATVTDEPTNPPLEERKLAEIALDFYTQGMERLGYEATGGNTYEEIMAGMNLTPSSDQPITTALAYDYQGDDRVVVAYLDQLHNDLVTAHEKGDDEITRFYIVDTAIQLYDFVMNGKPITKDGKNYYYERISPEAQDAAFAAFYASIEALKYSDQLDQLPVDDINRIMTYIENKQANHAKSLTK